MIRFLDLNLKETVAISLDNDLELIPGPDGRMIDPGSGVEVAEYLATMPAVCPVVIHTTNTNAAESMKSVLATSGSDPSAAAAASPLTGPSPGRR